MIYTLTVSIHLEHLIIACLLLAGFACLYNRWVEHLERVGHDLGYMSLIVALGVAIVIVAFGLVTNLWLALPLLACFVAAGAPMIYGSIARYVRARTEAERERDRVARAHLTAQED
jgi:hypothetical protein